MLCGREAGAACFSLQLFLPPAARVQSGVTAVKVALCMQNIVFSSLVDAFERQENTSGRGKL